MSHDISHPAQPGGEFSIALCGEQMLLHPDKALVWPARKTLLIADPHFGKDDVFRRAGIALPRGPAIADLQRLTALVDANGCERLMVLGDFIHAATHAGDDFLRAFRIWRSAHSQLVIEVVAGNHDRRENTEKWRTVAHWHDKAVVEPPFVFAHEPAGDPRGYVLAGHIHPAMHLTRVRRRMRVPVFWKRPDYLVLPSFGSFTGGAVIRPDKGDQVFAVGPERVVALQRP
jgi:DNA ligase-associated metallophosphoesterase